MKNASDNVGNVHCDADIANGGVLSCAVSVWSRTISNTPVPGEIIDDHRPGITRRRGGEYSGNTTQDRQPGSIPNQTMTLQTHIDAAVYHEVRNS